MNLEKKCNILKPDIAYMEHINVLYLHALASQLMAYVGQNS